MLIVGLGLMPLGSAAVHAGEQPQKGGYIIWAVHESMATFDIHFDTAYILAQPVAPLYNELVTQDPSNAGKINGDLAERWEITEDGKCITFFLPKGVKFYDGVAFTCADQPTHAIWYASRGVAEISASSTSRVASSMSRNGRKLPGRWSASCSTISPTIAAITGNRPWATGIGCRIGPTFGHDSV
jgi:ABC-type oligopeptide transport system substrate-binding subunit